MSAIAKKGGNTMDMVRICALVTLIGCAIFGVGGILACLGVAFADYMGIGGGILILIGLLGFGFSALFD